MNNAVLEVINKIKQVVSLDESQTESIKEILESHVIDKDFKNFLFTLGSKLETQDNYATANPLYCVYEKNEIVVEEGYSVDHTIWYSSDSQLEIRTDDEEAITEFVLEYAEEHNIDLEENTNKEVLEEAGFIFLNIREIDVFVNAHLTEAAAKSYIEKYHYNHKKPFLFVNSLYRCHEMNELQDKLKSLTK